MISYLGLGSNLGNSFQYLQNALDALQQHPSIKVQAYSHIYQSKPHGPQDQDDYLNAVVQIHTTLTPQQLLWCTQNIERQNQRQRNGQRWGARTLDIDILLYDHQCIETENLIIPHPYLYQRSFVLYPLADIVQDLTFPASHIHQQTQYKTLQCCLSHCSNNDLHKTALTFRVN